MKEELKYNDAEHKLVVCACSNPSHQLILSQYKTGEIFDDYELWLTVRTPDDTWWNKFKSLFKKRMYYAELMITPKEAKQFLDALQEFTKEKQ